MSAVQDVLNWTYTATQPTKKPAPLTAGGKIFVGASRSNQSRELAILVLDAADGKLLKTITIGTHVVDPNQLYYDRGSEPSMLLYRDRLYVDTHAGALVSIEPSSGTIDWGILYESPPPQTGYYYYQYEPPRYAISGPMFSGGLLFTKGMRSPRMLGVRADGPALAWNRPVDRASTLAAADDHCLYMAGDELSAYSLESQELLWSAQLPSTAIWSVPVVTKTRLYQFTSRGIYEVEKQTGRLKKLFRGIDLDAFGGTLLVTPKALVTVSNLAITAYPLNSDPAGTKTE